MRSHTLSAILSLILLVLSSLSVATAGADAPALPGGTIYYRLRMTFVLERQTTLELLGVPVSMHQESSGWVLASKVGVHWCCIAGPQRLEFHAYFPVGLYTGHTGSGHTLTLHKVGGRDRYCQADYKDTFKRRTAVTHAPGSLAFAKADVGRFKVGWNDEEPGDRPTVSTKYSDVRCQFGEQWRRVPGFTRPCVADCFVLPVSAPFSIPANGFGRDFFRKLVDTTKVEDTPSERAEWTQHFVLEFTKCGNQDPGGLCSPVE